MFEKFAEIQLPPAAAKCECLWRGIKAVRPGGLLSDIADAIQPHAESHGFSVRDFCGHGLGASFHKLPQVLHHREKTDSRKWNFSAILIVTIKIIW